MTIGANVANKKDKNNKDWDTNVGKKSIGNIIPTSNDLEKSGNGNSRIPKVKPKIIDIYAFFSLNDLE